MCSCLALSFDKVIFVSAVGAMELRATQFFEMSTRPKRSDPTYLVPMAAESGTALPEGPEWFYELKLDGYRALLLKNRAQVEIRSRNDKNLGRLYPHRIRLPFS
jgi:ATP-dependent DNA ligase